MIPEKSKEKTEDAIIPFFQVTEKIYRPVKNGKMVCLSTNETVDEKELKARGKGTWLKISQQS